MKKWLIIGLVVLIFIIWQGIAIYRDALSDKNSGNHFAVEQAEAQYDIRKIKSVTPFYGKQAYHVVEATLQNNSSVYIWVPDKKSDHRLKMLPISSGFSKAEILHAFKAQVPYKRIISTSLGMIDDQPAWEIVYIDNESHYVFSYYDFHNGDSLSAPIALK
ncbi:DUF5590 domain-containing protein [Camelliibacillus cellulosilyticus]|uniref:DUF5590 domain-containing protein n=1 Tax=Camelliibacillus cellulosilyticus TaxID=2174486 RepID=A0ABV9GKR2_9BACL